MTEIKVKGRIVYAHVLSPYKFKEEDDAKYSATFLIDASDTIQIKDINDAINKEALLYYNNNIPTHAVLTLLDGNTDYDNDLYAGYYVMHAKSKYAPSVITYKGADATPDDIYNGVMAVATIRLYGYKAGRNTGIGYGLGNICILNGGEKIEISTARDPRLEFAEYLELD